MSHRCQVCINSGRARKYQGHVVYLCQKHWREYRPYAAERTYRQMCAARIPVVCADADLFGNDNAEDN